MKTQPIRSRPTWFTAEALLVAAAGILIQIASGAEYPAIPPGLVILIGAAGLVISARWRWTPVAGVLVGVFLLIGLFASGRAPDLLDPSVPGDALGLWMQVIALLVAIVAGIAATRGNYRRASATRGSGVGA